MSDTTEKTTVQEVDLNLDDILGTGADNIMVPGEGGVEDKKPGFFSPTTPDTTFLDKPVDKVQATEEKKEEGGDTNPPAPEDNIVPPVDKTVEDVLAPPTDESVAAAEDETKNKGGRPTNMVAAAKSLIEKKILLPFEDEKKLEDYTAADFEELIEANMDMLRNNISQEMPTQFFQNMPVEMQQAYDYIANGGQDLKGMFQALASSQEMRQVDTNTEAGQVYAIRAYLQATNYGTPEEIEEEITSLADRGELEKKANQFKPKLDAMSEQVVQQRLAAQEQEKLQRQQQSQHYMDSVYTTLEGGDLNGIKLDNRTQNFLYAALVQPNYPSMSGKQTNLLGHLLEKFQWVEPNHALIAEATYLLADPDGYRAKIKAMGETEATANTVRKLKTEQANRTGSSSVEQNENNATRNTGTRGIPRQRKNFFKR